MRTNPGNNGPPDDRTAEERVIVVFQPGPNRPALFKNRRRDDNISTSNLVAWTAQDLDNSTILPPGSQLQHRTGMVKVVFPPKLLPLHHPLNPHPYANLTFATTAEYVAHLTSQVPKGQRRAGLYLESEDGLARNHWMVLAGSSYSISVPPPECILRLMQDMGATKAELPTRFRALIHPADLRFLANQVYTTWEHLENIGFNFHPAPAPQAVLRKIKARFRIKAPVTPLQHHIIIVLEAVILPPEMSWNDTLHTQLATPHTPTFNLWQNSTPIPWLDTYPTVSGYFSAKNPVPAVHETKPNPTATLSEYNQRRIAFEFIRQAARANHHARLQDHYEWLRPPTGPPPHVNAPVLFLPPFPAPPPESPAHLNITDSDEDDPSVEIVSDILTQHNSDPATPVPTSTHESPVPSTSHPLQYLEFPMKTSADPVKPKPDPGNKPTARLRGIVVTARGKYDKGPASNYPHLAKSFQDTLPDLTRSQAETLARLTMASTARNTCATQASVQRTILKLFPDRPTLFTTTKPGDQLVILSRLIEAGYKPTTAAAYIKSYDGIVATNGGFLHPKLPQFKRAMAGLRNLCHNPTAALADKKRKAYSLEALDLVTQLGVHLMRRKGWTSHKIALYRATILTLFYGRLRSSEALGTNNHSCDLYTSLLAGDVIISEKPDRALLLLRSAKYQEEQGALVAIPSLNRTNCPVRALRKYAKHRARLTSNQQLPFFLTEDRWTHGAGSPQAQAGVYTTHKFRKDTKAVVRELIKAKPRLKQSMSYLVTHSLRSGIPTELQDQDIPAEIRLQLGRWHSSAHHLYQKNASAAANTATIVEKHVNIMAQTTGERD